MKTKPSVLLLPFFALAVFFLTIYTVKDIQAASTGFHKQFIEAKHQNNFAGMKYLVQMSKDILPSEIEIIINEANTEGVNEGDRLRLLDLAYHLAKMHQEWNKGDNKIVAELEAILAEYRKKKVAQQAVLDRIREVEIVPGTFVLNTNANEMIAAGQNPVVYPHWVHRSFFRCKVCHENLLIMKRGANELSHENMDAGKFCGACHNGEMSFDTTNEKHCSRCHLYGTPLEQRLTDLTYYDAEKFSAIAERLGGKWHADKLTAEQLPLGKHDIVDWVALDELNASEPLSSLGDDSLDEGMRDTKILFVMPPKYSFMLDNVLWSHEIHTTWINCSICHESTHQREQIFTQKAGETRVSMIELKEGKSCGTCHGRVSFPVSNCKRCHNHRGVEVDENTIVRELTE